MIKSLKKVNIKNIKNIKNINFKSGVKSIKTRLMGLKKYDNLEVNTIMCCESAGVAILGLAYGMQSTGSNLGIFLSGMLSMASIFCSARFGKRMYELGKATMEENNNEQKDITALEVREI